MRHVRRSAASIGITAAMVVVITSCGYATDTTSRRVADTSAYVEGRVRNTMGGDTSHWFEYGTSTGYGTTTPHKTTIGVTSTNQPLVRETITGLEEATTYHYRLCANGSQGGMCSYDATFTTTTGHDSVTGSGTVFTVPEVGYGIGATIDARSLPGGASLTGVATVSPSVAYLKWSDDGAVTCMHVDGNRATVGMLAQPPDIDGQPPSAPYHRLIFIEDNGPTGDRYGTEIVADATVCPAATDADFPGFVLSGYYIPPVVTSGDFVIHGHQ